MNLSNRDQKRKTTVSLHRIIQRNSTQVDRRKSAATVKIAIEKELRVYVHANTVRNRLYEISLNGRVARKKLDVNKINRGKRRDYTKTMMEQPFHYWKRTYLSLTCLNLMGRL